MTPVRPRVPTTMRSADTSRAVAQMMWATDELIQLQHLAGRRNRQTAQELGQLSSAALFFAGKVVLDIFAACRSHGHVTSCRSAEDIDHGDCGKLVQAEVRQGAQRIAGAFREIDGSEDMPIEARRNSVCHQERVAARADRPLGRRASEHVQKCVVAMRANDQNVGHARLGGLDHLVRGRTQENLGAAVHAIDLAHRSSLLAQQHRGQFALGIDDALRPVIVDDMDKRYRSFEFPCQQSRAPNCPVRTRGEIRCDEYLLHAPLGHGLRHRQAAVARSIHPTKILLLSPYTRTDNDESFFLQPSQRNFPEDARRQMGANSPSAGRLAVRLEAMTPSAEMREISVRQGRHEAQDETRVLCQCLGCNRNDRAVAAT